MSFLNHSFVLMVSGDICSGPFAGVNCYLTNSDAANKVVNNLKVIGARYLLVAPDTPDQAQIIGHACDSAGLQFFTYERWAWEAAIDTNTRHFSCDSYLNERVNKFLVPLKRMFPASFFGFHFKDEPGLIHLDNLGSLQECLRKQPEFEGMKIFMNLPPIHANYEALSGLAEDQAGARSTSDFGVDCNRNEIADRHKVKEMTLGYSLYVQMAAEKVRPDFLSFDLYPFTPSLINCTAALELLMSENMSNVSSWARSLGLTPVAYLQNVRSKSSDGEFLYADFHSLRWFTSWALAFGIKEFANFQSHDNGDCLGLLDLENEPRLAGDQQSVFGFVRLIQDALVPYRWNKFVAPFLGVMSGDILGWLPSPDVLAGEYLKDGDLTQAMVFFARRPIEGIVRCEAAFQQWWQTIEYLNVGTGQWELVSHSTNNIVVTLDLFPGALYRFSK